MTHAKPSVSIPKPKKEIRPIIRSPAFKRKYEDGMPRINYKAIPLHNLYEIEVNNIEVAQEKDLKFWSCVMPQPRKFKTRKV